MGTWAARVILPGDLRLRVITVVGVLVILTPLVTPAAGLVWLGVAVTLALMDPNPFPWRRLLHLEAFLAVLLITLPLTIPGQPVFEVWGLSASHEGLTRAVLVAAKVTAAMVFLTVAFAPVAPVRLGQALRALHCPERLVRLLLGVIRYLDLIRGEVARLQDAMRMRCFHPRSNLHTMRSYGNVIGMVLIRALARADRVDEAMRMRGYSGQMPVPVFARAGWSDKMATALCILAAIGLLVWDRG